jgi:hypothetical protein
MSRPYDLDLDVQLVLAREKELAKENAVASVNGALDIESKRGVGTRLTVEIPLA